MRANSCLPPVLFRVELALLLFPLTLWGGDFFIDDVSHPGGLAPGGFAEIDGAFFDGAAKVTVGGLDAAVYPLGSYQTCDGCEVAIFIQIPGPVAVGSTTLVLTQISGQPGVMFIPAAGHTQGKLPKAAAAEAPVSNLIVVSYCGAPGLTRTADLLVRSQRTFPNSLIIEQIFLQENSI